MDGKEDGGTQIIAPCQLCGSQTNSVELKPYYPEGFGRRVGKSLGYIEDSLVQVLVC